MKIQLYVNSRQDPNQIASQAQSIVEQTTGQPCYVRIVNNSKGPGTNGILQRFKTPS